jgi:hypothetical protein
MKTAGYDGLALRSIKMQRGSIMVEGAFMPPDELRNG